MRVEYKCTFERVNDIIDAARNNDREIDYIDLTLGEWFAFHKKLGSSLFATGGFSIMGSQSVEYRGVTINKVDSI